MNIILNALSYNWYQQHEKISTKILEYCIWKDCEDDFKKYGFEKVHLEFIKKLIDHDRNFKDLPEGEQTRRYLYEVGYHKYV